MKKTFFLRTLGCKTNQCDSQEIRQKFLRAGWQEMERGKDARLAIINTCCVTHQADRKSRQAIRGIAKGKRRGQPLVLVTGCYAAYDRQEVGNISGISAVFGPEERGSLFQWLDAQAGGNNATIPKQGVISCFGAHTRAFLKIQDGCNNRCSYCVVGLVRGPSKSRAVSEVIEAAGHLVNAGHQEVVLTGVNLGSYGRELVPAVELTAVITALEKIEGLARIRLSSIEPAEIPDDLLDKMASSKKLCPHLHIPFQSGDNEVLKAMNKTITVEDYEMIVEKAKNKIKDLAITCDIIVGFPQESEKNFKNTIRFLSLVKPLKTHIFTFSRRHGTPAASFSSEGAADVDEVKERFKYLKNFTDELSLEFRRSYLGRKLVVLFEEEKTGLWQGYSQNYLKISVRSRLSLKNTLARVEVTGCKGDLTTAELLQPFI